MNIPHRNPSSRSIDNLRAVTALRLAVGEHVVDLGSLRVTTKAGQPKLTPKAAGVLLELSKRSGQTVTHDHLLDLVWAGTCPTKNVLTQAIKELRRALDEEGGDSCIETVPKIGYRLAVSANLKEPEPVVATVVATASPPRSQAEPRYPVEAATWVARLPEGADVGLHSLRVGLFAAALAVLMLLLVSGIGSN